MQPLEPLGVQQAPSDQLSAHVETIEAVEAQITRKGSVPIARVAGWNAWRTADGKPFPMLRVSLLGIPGTPLNVPPHVMRSLGADVLFLMVRVGHETEDATALLAVLEQQEEPTVYVMPSTDAEGVFWWSDDDPDGDPFPIQVVAKLPRL